MPFSFSVAMTELPCGTLRTVSPLMVILTFPLGERYFFATRSITTSRMMTAIKTPILEMMKFISMMMIFSE